MERHTASCAARYGRGLQITALVPQKCMVGKIQVGMPSRGKGHPWQLGGPSPFY